jgi:glycosyltransferase involved in cell wall biosynthesis
MASRTAVLLSPGCHFPDVESEGAGLIADSSPAVLASTLATLLGDKERLTKMGRAGANLVASRYGVDRMVKLTLDTYEEGLARFRRSRPISSS